MNGFFIVDKPMGITSQQVVNQIKRKFQLKKCGHNGTLDPNATGIMVIACNEATKLMKFLNEHDKEYETTICFGYTSNTLDVWGNVSEEGGMEFTVEDLDSALEALKLRTSQIPPMVSAIKVKGKKLYEYERAHQTVEVKPREVKLYDVVRYSDLRWTNGHLEVDVKLHCSKGFYVRSFARDLGELLGGKAIITSLRRTRSGKFSLACAQPLLELSLNDFLTIEQLFPDFSFLEVNDFVAKLASNGVVLDERQIKTNQPFYIVHNHAIIALYECVDIYKYKPLIIFKK